MAIYMQTTTKDPSKTAGEIMALLAKYGADAITNVYKGGELVGMAFTIKVNGNPIPFTLPANVKAVAERLRDDGKMSMTRAEKQAPRTAWRILLRWVQAQLAMIDCGQCELAEVFTPYISIKGGQTLYGLIRDGGLKALPFKGGD